MLTPERQAEIVGWFGTLGADTGPEGEVWTTMDNAMDRGRARLPLHCDIIFFRYHLEGISLHPVHTRSGHCENLRESGMRQFVIIKSGRELTGE